MKDGKATNPMQSMAVARVRQWGWQLLSRAPWQCPDQAEGPGTHGDGKGCEEMAAHRIPCVCVLLVVPIPGYAAQDEAGGKGRDAQPRVWMQAAVTSLMLGLGGL